MTDLGVGSWIARRARMVPDAAAFRQGERSLSYSEAAGRIDALAGALHALGVRHGDRVSYLGPNDIATFETFFAAGRLGAIFVPLNYRLTGPEINFMLADSGARVLVHPAETAALAASADPTAAGVAEVISLETDYEVLLAAAKAAPATEVALEDDAVILYTSGTTGRPKGAVLTHGNLTWNTMNQLAHFDALSTDVVLCTSPLFHATGLGQVSLPTLFKGGTVVVAPKFDAAWMLSTVAELRINAFSAVPTMLQLLCDEPGWEAADLSSLRYVNYGGSAVLARVADAWLARGIPVLQGYGMTEASPGVFMALPHGAQQRPVSAGVPHLFTDVALLNADGVVQPPPGTGELLVRGPNVFRGYWSRPAETAASFVDGQWFRSGDIVRIDDDGWAYVVDRVKDMIISGGENIYPAEVEALINRIDGVVDCAVIAVPDERWGEVGMACIVRRPSAGPDERIVRETLESELARFKIPKYLRFVDDLPRTATGKVRKAELRATFIQLSKDKV
jgi:fatty-acyl-CoA synthase